MIVCEESDLIQLTSECSEVEKLKSMIERKNVENECLKKALKREKRNWKKFENLTNVSWKHIFLSSML